MREEFKEVMDDVRIAIQSSKHPIDTEHLSACVGARLKLFFKEQESKLTITEEENELLQYFVTFCSARRQHYDSIEYHPDLSKMWGDKENTFKTLLTKLKTLTEK